jgi:hypothetical protein
MAMPVLKCPYLAQLTLQQVRASAPFILNAGVESCPIFSQCIRKTSTSMNTSSNSFHFDEIKAMHEKVLGLNKRKIPIIMQRMSNPYGESKNTSFVIVIGTLISSYYFG